MSAPNNVEPNLNKALYYALLFFVGTVLFYTGLVYLEATYYSDLPWS